MVEGQGTKVAVVGWKVGGWHLVKGGVRRKRRTTRRESWMTKGKVGEGTLVLRPSSAPLIRRRVARGVADWPTE